MSYHSLALTLKSISSPIRLEIIDLLSCEELCLCDLLKHFEVTQPTLSHHLKSLREVNLISMRKEGNRHFYSLNKKQYEAIIEEMKGIGLKQSPCICNIITKGEC